MNPLSCRSETRAPLSLFLGVVLVVAASQSLRAQSDQTWLITGPSDIWDTTANNWDGGTNWVDGNNAIFGGSAETISLGSSVTVNNITFNIDGYVIEDPTSAGVLTLSSASEITVTNSADSAEISEDLTTGGIEKLGDGTLVLSGNNSFDGAVTISEGRLTAGSNTALGTATGATSVSSGAQLRLADGVNVSGETVNITGSGIDFSGALNVASGDSAEWSGDIVNTSARVGAGAGGTLTLSGGISGNSLTFSSFGTEAGSGAGVVVISGATKTYSGNTNIIRGILRLGATDVLSSATVLNIDSSTAPEDSILDMAGFDQTVAGLFRGSTGGLGGAIITNSGGSASTLTVNQGGGTRVYSGSIEDGTAAVNLTKLGNGVLELSGASTTSGEIRVEGGELLISNNNALGNTTGDSVATGGGRIVLADGVTITGETARIVGTGGNNNGAIQTASGATATWDGNIQIAGNTRVGGGENGTLNVNGVISGASNRTILFSRGTNAVTVLNEVNTYTGDTQMFASAGTGATLRLGVDNAINSQSRFSMLTANASQQMNLDFAGFDLALRGIDTSNRHDRGGNILFSNEATSSESVFTIVGTTEDFNSTAIIADGASGTGGMSLVKEGNSAQTLLGANTYTGSTTVRGGTLRIGRSVSTFGSGGSLVSVEINLEGGTFELNNLGANNSNNDRLSDAATLRFLGGDFLYSGSDQATTNSTETLGAFSFEKGISTATIRFGGTNIAEANIGIITRASLGGLGFINGLNLGQDGTSTSSVARIKATAPPMLIGSTAALSTGINTTAKDTEIVPFLVGSATVSSGGLGTEGSTPNTFLTYEASTGLRPLNPTDEFTNNSVVAGDNIRATSTTQATSSVSINSLVLDGGDFDVLNGSTVTVDSGAILFVSGSNNREIGGTTTTTLDFGAQEGIVTINSAGNTSIRPSISGTGGMSVYGSGRYIPRSNQSDYSGDTLLQVAEVVPTTSSIGPAGAPTSGPFGVGRVILDGSGIRSTTSQATTIANQIVIRSDTEILAAGSGAENLIFTGPVTLEEGDRILTHNSSADTIFSGVIGDGGNAFGFTVDGSGTGSVILEGANTYTGDTTVESGTLVVDGSTASASTVSVASGATLAGAGTIGGNTIVSGSLSAGTDGTIGSLGFTNDLTVNSGASWLVDLVGSSGASADSDLINVGGALDISGATLAINYNSANFAYGDKFTIASYGTRTGEFAGLANGSEITFTPDERFRINYADNGNFITLTAVPEPSTWLFLASLLVAAFYLRRRGSKIQVAWR